MERFLVFSVIYLYVIYYYTVQKPEVDPAYPNLRGEQVGKQTRRLFPHTALYGRDVDECYRQYIESEERPYDPAYNVLKYLQFC